jgi:hypothetical protein
VIAMSRQAWNPETASEEQLRLRQAAIEAFRDVDRRLDGAWVLAGLAHAAGVPMEDLEAQTKRSRSTLFRNAKKPASVVLWRLTNLDEVQAVRPDAHLAEHDDPERGIKRGDLLVEDVNEPGQWHVVGLNYPVYRRA